jgi:pimeloyl-ACP methyl ester carboxylesterase
MTTGIVTVNGAELYYESVGTGYPLVLIHAGIADSRLWDRQMSAFSERYQVIRYDLRGYGRSSNPDGGFAHYRDLHGLLTHLGISKAHLCGVSMGGTTALDFTLVYPAMVSAVITVGSSASGYSVPRSEEEIAYWEKYNADWDARYREGDLAAANEMEVKLWVDGSRDPAAVDPAVRALVAEMNLLSISKLNPNSPFERLYPPAAGRLREIGVPVLVMVGELDVPSAHQHADYLVSNLRSVERFTLPGTTHVPNLEAPAMFNEEVLSFLSAIDEANV